MKIKVYFWEWDKYKYNLSFKNAKYILIWIILTLSIWYVYFFQWWHNSILLLIAAILGLYMAMNIWANDIANNMGPAVWSKALTLTWAIIIAWIFEASWALIAWWDVVNTIKWWIIDASLIEDSTRFVLIMIATLLGWALWINIATFFKAPVSATHSIIWWLIWAWAMAEWFWIVNWWKIIQIANSWIISPIMWWIIAIIIYYSIMKNIINKDKRWDAAMIRVPIYVWIMSWTFTTYLIIKGLKKIIEWTFIWQYLHNPQAIFIWYVVWIMVFLILRIIYTKHSSRFKNSKTFINQLFNIPLIFAVALLSFAHWANDVANAIGPIAAISDSIDKNTGKIIENLIFTWDVGIEIWVMIIWAIWLVLWLSIFGWRLIKTVWWEITKLNQSRAFCIALATAITVIIASQLWLPVSSTQIALGWIFGIGLYREHVKRAQWKEKEYIEKSMIRNIALSWFITLPISWGIAALTFFTISKMV